MNQLKAVAKSIKSMIADINTEVIIADLIEKGFDYSEIVVKHDGLFKRNFSNDILDAYYDMVKDLLVLHISRDSLYDVLPYGLFHHIFSDFNSENRRLEFEKLKQEIDNARKLFLPFDNEFFNQYTELELELRKYFKNPGHFFQNLLLLNKSVPHQYAVKLTIYLLFADRIIGNPGFTALLLSDILGEDVHHSEFYTNEYLLFEENKLHSQNINVGESLGIDYICGDTHSEGRNVWEFSIILNNASTIEKYLNKGNGSILEFIELFYDFFVPFEIEVRTKIHCNQLTPFIIGPTNKEPKIHERNESNNYLGYNTII